MRQVMESRGLGKFIVSMDRRQRGSDFGPAPNRRASTSVDERDHGPNPQGSQIASTPGIYTANSRKSCRGEGQNQDHSSCSTQGSQKLPRELSIMDKCEKTHDSQFLYFRCITQMNNIIQHKHQGLKYQGRQSSSTQINSCIKVAFENFALELFRSTHKTRRILSSHAANLQVISTPTENLNGRSTIFKDTSYLPSTRRKAILPNLPSWPDPRSGSSIIEALLKDLEGAMIVPLTNIDQHQPW